MVQRGSGARLAPKTFQSLRILRHCLGQKFQRNETAKLGVFGFVHNAHAAATKFFDDAVVRDGLADHAGVTAHDRVRLRASQRGPDASRCDNSV
jgi:hypothetical protein